MPAFIDLTNLKFAHLTVISYYEKRGRHHFWLCECDCINRTEKIIDGRNLRNGNTMSCGCHQKLMTGNANKTHGEARTSENKIWRLIKNRCNNPNATYYERYGGRGIKICDRWKNSYENFKTDIGPRPSPKHTVDRIDNDGNYSCGHCEQCVAYGWTSNCRWATWIEQCNNKSTNHHITYDGKTMTIAQWTKEKGFRCPTIIHSRIQRGWTIHEALMTPERLCASRGPKRKLTFNGETLSIAEWSIKTGINRKTLYERLRRYWSISDALTIPARKTL